MLILVISTVLFRLTPAVWSEVFVTESPNHVNYSITIERDRDRDRELIFPFFSGEGL